MLRKPNKKLLELIKYYKCRSWEILYDTILKFDAERREQMKGLKLCKYAEIISMKLPIECKYKNILHGAHEQPIIIFHCPKDSGTDEKCNNLCYEYKITEN